MEALAAALGVAIGVAFGWSMYGWLEGRERRKIERFHDELDRARRRRTGVDL